MVLVIYTAYLQRPVTRKVDLDPLFSFARSKYIEIFGPPDKRNLHKCPSITKSNCYKAMVKPILEYAAIIWSPHTQRDINMIE